MHFGIQYICLELHQEVVGDRTTIDTQRRKLDARIGLHRIQHITRLVSDTFQRCANNVV
ncbi:Uncharacterised protein [Vibrio cholerae]|nr:Uncharacterised protein [Vibrio cholerae]CRZ87428.1 Uncharacterised protein [Vibrio cholerae]